MPSWSQKTCDPPSPSTWSIAEGEGTSVREKESVSITWDPTEAAEKTKTLVTQGNAVTMHGSIGLSKIYKMRREP